MGQVGGYVKLEWEVSLWRPVRQATGSEGAVSVCSGRKTGTCVPPQGKVRADYSNQGTGNYRPDGEHNVVDATRG